MIYGCGRIKQVTSPWLVEPVPAAAVMVKVIVSQIREGGIMEKIPQVQWCQCEHSQKERHETCEVVCICKKCGKPIKRTKEESPPEKK